MRCGIRFVLIMFFYIVIGTYNTSAEEVYTINYYYLVSLSSILQHKVPQEIKNSNKVMSKDFVVDGKLVCWNNVDGKPIKIYEDDWFSSERALLLSEEESVIDFLHKKGLKNINDYLIFHIGTNFNYFNIFVDADDGLWIIPILNHEETQCNYENGKVYTVEEFYDRGTYETTGNINYEKRLSSVLVRHNNTFFPLRETLSALIDDAVFNSETNSYTVNDRIMTFTQDPSAPPGLDEIIRISGDKRSFRYIRYNNTEYISVYDLHSIMNLFNISLDASFDPADKIVYIITDDSNCKYNNAIENTYKLIAEEEMEPCSPIIRYNMKEYIPIRDFAEAIGEEILWDEEEKIVQLSGYEFDVGNFAKDYTYYTDNAIGGGLINTSHNGVLLKFDCIMFNDRLLISRDELHHIAAEHNFCLLVNHDEKKVHFENFEKWRKCD